MKAIKVVESNKAKIEAALHAVNGHASQHAYTSYGEIAGLSARADRGLVGLGIAKSHHQGAVLKAVSGGRVPNAYKYTRRATFVALERRSAAWWLIEVAATDIYKDGGKERLHLTQRQDVIAVEALRAGYSIQPPQEAA